MNGSPEILRSLSSHVEATLQEYGGTHLHSFQRIYDGRDLPCSKFDISSGIELLFVASSGYPGIPPVLLVTHSGSETIQINLDWDLTLPSEQRLSTALRGIIKGSPPFSLAYGPSIDVLLTEDAELADEAGWRPFIAGSVQSGSLEESLFERSKGLLSPSLKEKSALIVGLGSGGSYTAESLVRCGLGNIILIDGDLVEPHNLSRTTYYACDIGKPKALALSRHLLNINPSVKITAFDEDLAGVGTQKLTDLVKQTDLIIALTDDPYAQARLNHFSFYHNTPSIFAALYRGARGGEVIVCVPGETPCLECSTGGVRESVSRPVSDVNYGTGRLPGEQAIAADIQHLDSATVKLSLGVLLREHEELAIASFLEGALKNRFTYLCMSMAPDYWIFPHLLKDAPGQYGYGAIWLTPEGRDDCQYCGSGTCEDPAVFPLGPVRVNL